MKRDHGGIGSLNNRRAALINYDFSTNINPYIPKATFKDCLLESELAVYPEPQAESLAQEIKHHLHLSSHEYVVIGNGAIDLIWSYVRCFIKDRQKVLIIEPSFSEFEQAAKQVSADIVKIRRSEIDSFSYDYDLIEKTIEEQHIDHLYLIHPNSPCGTALDLDWLMSITTRHPKLGICLDLAFFSLSDLQADMPLSFPTQVFRVVSLTKDFAIAGIRLGYAITSYENKQLIESQRPCWSINSLAIKIGKKCLNLSNLLAQSNLRIKDDTMYLLAQLKKRHIIHHHDKAPMILIACKDSIKLKHLLIEEGILVRDCSSYKLDRWIRIFPRPKKDADILLEAIDKYLEHFRKESL